MKKTMAFLLAAALTAAVTACGGKDSSSEGSGSAKQSSADASSSDTSTDEISLVPLEPGKLLVYPLAPGESQMLRGISLSGNRAGSSEFNSKSPSTEDIRCIFELNEWVDVYLDTDAESGLKCWTFRHQDEPEFYLDNTVSEDAEGFVQVCELSKNPDDANASWGSFYLSPEDCSPGLYDLVFTSSGKPVAVILTRFYNEEELGSRSDEELTQLNNGILS